MNCDLLESLFNGAFLICFADLEKLDFPSKLLHPLSLIVERLLDLDYALLESDFHQEELILGRVFEQMQNDVHLFHVLLFAPEE